MRLLVFFMFIASLQKPAASDDAHTTLTRLAETMRGLPDISYHYRIEYQNDAGTPVRYFTFAKHQQHYVYKMYHSETDLSNDLPSQIVSYDGDRFYCLRGDYLIVSRQAYAGTAFQIQDVTRSHHLQNPWYALFSYLHDRTGPTPFSFPETQELATWIPPVSSSVGELLEEGDERRWRQSLENGKVTFDTYLAAGHFRPVRCVGKADNGWGLELTVDQWHTLPSPHGPVEFPLVITTKRGLPIKETTKGEKLTVDALSIKLLESPPDIRLFRVPLSAAVKFEDADSGESWDLSKKIRR